jgi:uncharacterized phage-associated protein
MKTTFGFRNAFAFSEIHKDRIGYLINYIARKIPHLYCTRLIKLLYIIDETAMIKLGTPITWMKYYVYKMGPVPKNLWISIKDGNEIFGEYFDVIEEDGNDVNEDSKNYKINAIDQANMSEFSLYEQSIVDSVIDVYGDMPVDTLIEYLHREGSLWHQIVNEKEISFTKTSSSDYEIDLSKLIGSDKFKLSIYRDAMQEINLLESLS